MNNELIRIVVRCLQHFEGLQYNRINKQFYINDSCIPEYEIKRFIIEKHAIDLDSLLMSKILKKLALKVRV